MMKTLLKWLIRAALAFAGSLILSFFTWRAVRYSFRRRVVLITGGSRGLGLELARRFAAQGARLMLVARNADELDRAARELRSAGATVETFTGDVTQAEVPETAVEATVQAYGRLDVVVNNAGLILVGPLDNLTEADYETAMATHFWGPLRFMNAARPHLKASRGRIVNICSIGAKVAVPHLAPYSASKFALAGLSDAYRAELAREGIRVTSVFPGLLRTGSHIQALFKGQRDREFAWFSLGSATPLTSISSRRAAKQIVSACRRGAPQLVISIQARLLSLAAAIFPNLTGRIIALANRALPHAGPPGDALPGWGIRGDFPPASVTTIPDRASVLNNELPH